MLVRLETNPLTPALIVLTYDAKGRCKEMMRIPEESGEESILFFAWYLAAKNW